MSRKVNGYIPVDEIVQRNHERVTPRKVVSHKQGRICVIDNQITSSIEEPNEESGRSGFEGVM
jgi:hypothetical protein